MIDEIQIGPYQLQRPLGVGSRCAVFEAVHRKKGRHVALTRLVNEAVGTQAEQERFLRELKYLKSMRHPRIVRCVGGVIHHGRAYLAAKLHRGESLRARLGREGPLSWRRAARIVAEACEGLEYAHQRGLVHPALSADQLMLGESDRVALLGLRRLDRRNQPTRQVAEPTLDKAAYLAPEQCQSLQISSPSSTIYSLGCLLYEMLTGAPPFTAPFVNQLLQAHLEKRPPRPSAMGCDCPRWLDELVMQMLAKQPQDRPALASLVARRLQRNGQFESRVDHDRRCMVRRKKSSPRGAGTTRGDQTRRGGSDIAITSGKTRHANERRPKRGSSLDSRQWLGC